MNILLAILLLLPLTLGAGPGDVHIGDTLDSVKAGLGEPSKEYVKDPGLKEYVFDKGDMKVRVTPVNERIERLNYWAKRPFTDEEIETFLAANGEGWSAVENVSHLEKKIWWFSARSEEFRKLVTSDGERTAFYGPDWRSSDEYNLLIFTRKYLEGRAQAIPDITEKSEDSSEEQRHQEKRLEYGYCIASKKLLDDFFELWYSQSAPLKRSVRELPNLVEDAYQIFEDFYNPLNLKRIGKSEWGDGIYGGRKYLIVQKELRVRQRDGLLRDEDGGPFDDFVASPIVDVTIHGFRPDLAIDGARCVFLDDFYTECLEEFLGDEQYDMGTGNIMNPAAARDESKKRLEYLDGMAKIHHGHWQGWHLESHPEVFWIDFNKDLTEAIVAFKIVYQGGEAVYKKKDGVWKLEESGLTWIE